jgi:hypothetical protein
MAASVFGAKRGPNLKRQQTTEIVEEKFDDGSGGG